METYTVEIVVYHSFEVEADNEKEAREIAEDVDWYDYKDGYEMFVKLAAGSPAG